MAAIVTATGDVRDSRITVFQRRAMFCCRTLREGGGRRERRERREEGGRKEERGGKE